MSGVGICLVIVILVLISMVYIFDFEWSEACIAGFCIGVCLAMIVIVETYDTLWTFK